MNLITKKNISLLVVASFIFSLAFYLAWHRQPSVKTEKVLISNHIAEQNTNLQDHSLKKKLTADFESAFLRQYTPLLGCEEFHTEDVPAKCIKHLEQAKNDFKDKYIKSRGLPKNTFEELQLSFVD